jgi:hypothetical protein
VPRYCAQLRSPWSRQRCHNLGDLATTWQVRRRTVRAPLAGQAAAERCSTSSVAEETVNSLSSFIGRVVMIQAGELCGKCKDRVKHAASPFVFPFVFV